MKIAAVSEDGTTISHHFGRAPFFVVVTVEEGKITARETREKTGCHPGGHGDHEHGGDHHHHHHHHHHHGTQGHGTAPHAQHRHTGMAAAISDCEAVLARGMGTGAYQGMTASGLRPIITDIATIDEAVQAYLEGRIVDHIERLH
ncbi:MAG: dinitrogenase iron-molybdenum cofactor biosynthesis protein [Chloroflexaceae bacterium]|nr:dinitrogenase iron-molybdenum cofactor biosynthesis protein [Chloroflexaceae bacterium]